MGVIKDKEVEDCKKGATVGSCTWSQTFLSLLGEQLAAVTAVTDSSTTREQVTVLTMH